MVKLLSKITPLRLDMVNQLSKAILHILLRFAPVNNKTGAWSLEQTGTPKGSYSRLWNIRSSYAVIRRYIIERICLGFFRGEFSLLHNSIRGVAGVGGELHSTERSSNSAPRAHMFSDLLRSSNQSPCRRDPGNHATAAQLGAEEEIALHQWGSKTEQNTFAQDF